MDVILLERIEKLGQMGDVVKVKPGFARNFLLPQRKALRATKENLAVFEAQRSQLEADNLKRRDEAEKIAEKIKDLSLVMIRQAGETGQLYGSVNTRDVAEAITDHGVTVHRSQVVMDNVIKVLGLHPVRLRLHPEVVLEISVNVARSQEEAEAQAAAGRTVTLEEQREAAEAAEEAVISQVEAAEAAEEEAEAAASEEAAEAEEGPAEEEESKA